MAAITPTTTTRDNRAVGMIHNSGLLLLLLVSADTLKNVEGEIVVGLRKNKIKMRYI